MSQHFSNDLNDPFNQPSTRTDSSEWLITQHSKPRWTLLTEKEKKEQDKVIKKLEFKIKKVKQQSYQNYTGMPEMSTNHFHSSDSEQEDEYTEDDDEGQSLLNKSKKKKKEDQYVKYFYCCC